MDENHSEFNQIMINVILFDIFMLVLYMFMLKLSYVN